jgi:AraC-like DNA-binding protein
MLWITLFAGYHGLLQKNLGKVTEIPGGETDQDPSSKTEEYNVKIKYSRSSLSAGQKQTLIIELEKLILVEKIFTNSQLTVEDVARLLGTNAKYISQVLNEHYNKNFYTFINAHRVEEARRLLLMDVNRRYSILGISQMAGFSSKSSFNDAFKTLTGATPTELRKQKVNAIS